MTRIAELALFVDDVDAGIAFYRQVLGAEPDAAWTGGAIFVAGETKLLVHARTIDMENAPPNEDHFALSCSDLDVTCANLRAVGVDFVVEPRDFPWGRSAYLRDPDGRLVELTQD